MKEFEYSYEVQKAEKYIQAAINTKEVEAYAKELNDGARMQIELAKAKSLERIASALGEILQNVDRGEAMASLEESVRIWGSGE